MIIKYNKYSALYFSECEELECSQICLNVDRSDGNYESNCVCGNNYIMEPDGKTCTCAYYQKVQVLDVVICYNKFTVI